MARPFLRRNRRYGVRKTARATTARNVIRSYNARVARRTKFSQNRALAKANRPAAIRSIPRSLNPFPGTKWVVHRYSDRVSFAAVAQPGAGQGYQFRANSLYDPDATGGGHQPMFRDECAAQYSSYTVLASQIKLTIPNRKDHDVPIWFSLVTDDTATAETNRTQLWETRKNWLVTTPSLRNNNITMRATFDAAKILKTSRKAILADDTFKTGKDTDPNRAWYFYFWYQPLSAVDSLLALDIVIEMSFVTLWRDKRPPTIS